MMPARKPVSLHVDDRHRTRKEARIAAGAALTPQESLSSSPPRELRSDRIACATWRKLTRLYSSLDAEIVSGLDHWTLIEFCIGVSELAELRLLRSKAVKLRNFDLLLQLDQRVDRKGSRLDQLRQTLYLTPRARAGVSPAVKKLSPGELIDRELKEIFGDDYGDD